MKLFDYRCTQGCGRVFEALVVDPRETIVCTSCHLPCEKQMGGRPMRSRGDSGPTELYPPPSDPVEQGEEDAFVGRMMQDLGFECRDRVLAQVDNGDAIISLIEHTHVPVKPKVKA